MKRTLIVAFAGVALASALAACGKQSDLERPGPMWGAKQRAEYSAQKRAQAAKADNESAANAVAEPQNPALEPYEDPEGLDADVKLMAGIGAWLEFYNTERQHQSLGYRTPQRVYQEGPWICGRSALPTGCASPASRASSESREMLAFDHIPTGTTTNQGFDIDEVNGRLVQTAVAPTAAGDDIETGRVTP